MKVLKPKLVIDTNVLITTINRKNPVTNVPDARGTGD